MWSQITGGGNHYLDMLAQISTFLKFLLVFFHNVFGLLQFIGRMTISNTSSVGHHVLYIGTLLTRRPGPSAFQLRLLSLEGRQSFSSIP